MTPRVDRILVGVDGSGNAHRALEWAVFLGRALGAEVLAAHAVGLLTHLGTEGAVPSHSHLAELRQAFETEWCSLLADSGVRHRLLLLDGAPVPVLLAAAQREEVDLIVVGSRGAGGFAELLLGSTSHQVAEHTDLPVVIVPPARPAGAGGAARV